MIVRRTRWAKRLRYWKACAECYMHNHDSVLTRMEALQDRISLAMNMLEDDSLFGDEKHEERCAVYEVLQSAGDENYHS